MSQPLQAQTYKVIYNFTGIGNDGATPYAGPVLLNGNLYGTTYRIRKVPDFEGQIPQEIIDAESRLREQSAQQRTQ